MKDMTGSKTGRMTRRRALKYAGVAVGAAAMPSVLFAGDRRSRGRAGSLKVGLITPAASLHPTMGQSFVEGMAASLSRVGGGALQILREDVTTHVPLAACRKLVERERVDVIIGLLNTGVATLLTSQFPEAPVPFIVSNLGENILRETEYSPWIFHCTMNLWQGNWALGRWAATYLGSRAFVVTSLYDSGYDALYAFRMGLESAGGKVVETLVSDNGDIGSTIAAIRKSSAHFTFALHHGEAAEQFLAAYADARLAPEIPLAGSAFLADERTLARVGQAASGLITPFSWAPSLSGLHNLSFAAQLGELGRLDSDAFAVLGYDTGELLLAALAAGGGQDRWLRTLKTASIDSPRGRLRMDPETQTLVAPVYVREVRMNGGRAANTVIDTIEDLSEFDEHVRSLRAAVRSGWHNTYLCL